MYCKHFGFEESPFGVTSDPQFFYSNIANEEILAALAREIERGNALVVVTGEAGTGKTTLLRRLIGGLPGTINCAFIIVNARLSFIALLRRILKEVGVSNTSTDRESLLEQLNNYVQEQFTKDRSVALLFDEAQAMSDEVLKEIPSLCDSDSKKLMSIVLMGQPDLERRLGHSNLRSLKQQITLTRRLTPLKQNDDVGPYITSKLEQAGFKGDELFEPAAIERIISWSSGIPRLINTICDNALLLAYQASECTVTAGMIDEVANHLRLVECPPRAHQKKIDEAGDQPRFVGRSAIGEKIDAVANQPRFDDQPPVEDQSEIDEVASQLRLDDRLPIEEQRKIDEAINQPRFIDHSPVADQKRVDEVGDQPHFDDQPPVENQIEIDEVASQLRLDDRLPIEDQEKIDEVGDQRRFVDRSPIAEEIDAVANQPRFDDQPPVEDQSEIDEVTSQLRLDARLPIEEQRKIDEAVNQPRFIDHSPVADQKRVDEVGDQPHFDDQPPVENQIEIDEVASQLRLDDRLPIEDQEKLDEVGDQPRFDDQPPVEDQSEIDEVPNQFGFDDRPPIEDQEKIDEVGDQPRFVDRSPIAEEIDAVANQPRFDDQPPVEDQREIDEVANQLHLVDDRSAGSDQKPMLEIEQTQKLDIAFPMESVEAGSIIDDNAGEVSDQLIPPIYQARTVGQRNYQLSNVNRLRISIGALMILVVVAGGLAVFYPRQRQAVVPGINKYVENSRAEVNTVAAPAKPTQVDTNPVAEEGPQLASNSPPPSPVIQQDRGQKDARTAKKQNLVEVANVDKLVRPVSQQIYRVSGPSFLRNRPTANAEIVDTLQPGIRIAIISRSGEYFRVRSLGDANVFGFVHKEDAFFERIQ